MPTRRTWTFLIIAAFLYFLANQTQVGWIYVFVAAIGGLLLVSFLYERGLLKSIQIRRTLRNLTPADSAANGTVGNDPLERGWPTFHEDDPVEVTLDFRREGWRPAFALSGEEPCPFAPPAEQRQPFFIPTLSRQQPVTLRYKTTCDRRGAHTFPDLPLHSTGPFGFFQAKRRLAVPTDILIYPAYYPLKRLPLLERREFGPRQTDRVGAGTQIIGTREYRPGDSLRQVHWRSTARRNQLIVKEFSDDEQRSLTVVLDLAQDSSLGQGKFATFETAVRLAASFGYYADRKGLPFYLAGVGQRGTPPKTALSWAATLTYLAKVRNDGQTPLAHTLKEAPASAVVIVLVSQPRPDVVKALTSLSRRRSQVLALFITPDGNLPPEAQAATAPNLTIKGVVSERWVEAVESLQG